MQLQPHTGCNWRLISSTAGLRNGVLQSTRTSLPQPCSPCPQSKKLAPSLLVGPRWRRMKKQHTLVSHLTRGRPGNSTLQSRSKSQTQAGYSSQTCWYHWGSKQENTKNSVPGNSQNPSQVLLHSVVNHSKDQPTGTEPGTLSDYWCDVIHTDHINGEAHRSPTFLSTEGCQEHDAGKKVQVLDKPSHENQSGRSHQESAKK